MDTKKRINQILKDHGASLERQISQGYTRGIFLGFFCWRATKNGLEIELLN
jgi:hypothetical protein